MCLDEQCKAFVNWAVKTINHLCNASNLQQYWAPQVLSNMLLKLFAAFHVLQGKKWTLQDLAYPL